MATQILTIIYGVAIPAILSYIVLLIKNQTKQLDAKSDGIVLLLRIQLIEYHNKYMRMGKIPSYAYKNFDDMYRCYIVLDPDNGMIGKMKLEIDNLEIGKEENNYD